MSDLSIDSSGEESRAWRLYGTDEPEPPPLRLDTGRFSFEFVSGNLRTLSFDGFEVLRGIQYLIRDRDWGTLIPTIERLQVEDGKRVRVTYDAWCADEGGARLDYRAVIVANDAGLDFDVDCVARTAITINRLGFCVLHPSDCSGDRLQIEHGDGSVENSIFPVLIDPWQPFTDIRALRHEKGALRIECRLEGDTFEMEDQRNWSDASFKTYVRPLASPWPYEVPAGTRNRQSVRLRLVGKAPALLKSGDDVEVTIEDGIGTMPRIGLVAPPEEALALRESAQWLDRSGVQDLLLTYNKSAGHSSADFRLLANVAASLDMRKTLECVLECTGDLDAEFGAIAELVRETDLHIDGIAVFPAPDLQSTPPGSSWPECPPLEHLYRAARRAFPRVKLGGGMFSYFTEFNRKRIPSAQLDFVTHATCPIVHAADDLSVMQTLQAIPAIVRSARAIVPGKPYRLGPITIGMRQNPYGTRTIPNPFRRRVPMASKDPRQDGRFAAAWSLGYAAATDAGALETLTFGALTGQFGLIGADGPRPVFDAVAALAEIAGAPRRACRTSHVGKLAAVAAGDVLLLANLTAEPVRAKLWNGKIERLDAFAMARVVLD